MRRKLTVHHPQNNYGIFIDRGILSTIGPMLKKRGYSSKAVIVTNKTINELHGETVKKSLLNEEFELTVLEIPDTEKSKSLEMASMIYEELLQHRIERFTPIIALGGGVVGDLAGFVAATYLRGLPLIHLPTTLLAQVDSCIGGKTGVNYTHAKNIIGAFKDPELVLIDTEVLSTLPEEEMKNGVAEIIKYAMIRDASLFETLEESRENLLLSPPLEDIIEKCCRIKIGVVEKDKREIGVRKILNYGHTVGHALEAVTNFTLSHGGAVAIGMCAAARIAEKMGILYTEAVHRQEELIVQTGLPTTLPEVSTSAVLERMQYDKKTQRNHITFVLPEEIGTVAMRNDVPQETVKEVLEDLK